MKNYFQPSEFQRGGTNWYDKVDPELLMLINLYRHRLGYAVYISPHSQAIGRYAGTATTKHNYDRYGVVMAVDVMPEKYEPERWIRIAKELGFTGIGFYPDWRPNAGLHLDVRSIRGSRPATWGAVRDGAGAKQRYTSLAYAVKKGMRGMV